MFAVACLAAGLFAACGLDLNGLQTGGDDGGVGHLDATADVTNADATQEASSGDTGAPVDATGGDTSSSDTGTVGDVVVTETGPVDGCVPAGPESCTNGVDDDCNGLTDCADPACTTQGYACVAEAPPKGWDFVTFDATAQPGCTAPLKAKNVDVDPMSLSMPAVCTCTCGVGATPSCEQGNIVSSYGMTGPCNTPAMNLPANGGMCNVANLTVEPFVMAAQPAAAGGTCTPNTATAVPPSGATKGEYCTGQMTFGAGCTAPQVCALVPTGFKACVHHGGASVACPAGGYATSHAVGTVQDNRACGNSCGCGTPTATCTPGSWDFYASDDCSGAVGAVLTTDNVCRAAPGAGTVYASNRFSSTISSGSLACGLPTTPANPTGNAMLMGADTLCCE